MAKKDGVFVSLEYNWDDFQVWYWGKERWLKDVPHNKALRYNLANKYAKLIEPWVPYDTGRLNEYKIDRKDNYSIVYDPIDPVTGEHYAGYQYDLKAKNRNINHHPLATDHWDEAADPVISEEFRKYAGNEIWKAYKKQVLGRYY